MGALRTYYYLTKPGIVYGNLLAAGAGFFIGAQRHLAPFLLAQTLVGIGLVIASACVINNYIDRGIDASMARTKRRGLASGRVSAPIALAYAALLGMTGFLILWFFTNALTIGVGVIGFVDYVAVYALAKRLSRHGTLIGSLSGSVPLVAGYTAVTDRLDGGALILFLIMTFWQMPHFYAIAIRRLADYRAAGLPVLPAVKSRHTVKVQMVLYVAGFAAAAMALTAFGYTGYLYLVVMGLYAAGWLWLTAAGFRAADDQVWAKRVFLYSLVMLPLLFAVAPLDAWLR